MSADWSTQVMGGPPRTAQPIARRPGDGGDGGQHLLSGTPLSADVPPAAGPVQSLPTGTALAPGNIAATAPLPYQAFGSVAQVNPTYVDPANAQGYYGQYAQLLQSAMDPYFAQQQQQLTSDLRARGIQNSGAAGYLEGNLLGQQGATLAGQEAPLLSQAFGYNQQADMANAGYGNAASLYNANAYSGAVDKNYSAYNNYLNELFGLGASNYGALQGAYLNSFGPSTGVESGFNNALSGTSNAYTNVYGSAVQGQGAAVGGAFSGLGAAAAGGAFG